jgi:hypothetical protein
MMLESNGHQAQACPGAARVTRGLQWCHMYKGAIRVLHGCYLGVAYLLLIPSSQDSHPVAKIMRISSYTRRDYAHAHTHTHTRKHIHTHTRMHTHTHSRDERGTYGGREAIRYRVLGRVSQGCHKGCHKGATRVLQGCHQGVTRVSQGCYVSFT